MRLGFLPGAALVAGLVSVSVASAQNANVPAEFTQARTQRINALANGDRATFERLTTENFVVVDALGRVENKAERAARVTPPATPPTGPNPMLTGRLNERIAMYNNDTILLFWQTNTPNGIQNFMETWVKDGNQWKCAAADVSRPAAGGREGGRGEGRGRGGD